MRTSAVTAVATVCTLLNAESVGNSGVRPEECVASSGSFFLVPILLLLRLMWAVGESGVIGTDNPISYPVQVCKLTVVNDCHLACGEWDLRQHNRRAIWCRRPRFRSLDAEERVEGSR